MPWEILFQNGLTDSYQPGLRHAIIWLRTQEKAANHLYILVIMKEKGRKTNMTKPKVFTMDFAKIYPMYVQKAEKKQRTKEEVDEIICWLTAYDEKGLVDQIEKQVDLETFFAQAPQINPRSSLIKGVVCGVRVEEIEDPLMQQIRYLDKLVDELAKGKAMEKILR